MHAAPRRFCARRSSSRCVPAWLAAALAEHLTPAERGVLELASELMQRLAELSTE